MIGRELVTGDKPLVSRTYALSNGLSRYYTGKLCSRGHLCERLVANWTCVECAAFQKVCTPEKRKAANKKRRIKARNTPEKRAALNRKNLLKRKSTPEKRLILYNKKRLKYRVHDNLRSRMAQAIKKDWRSGSAVRDLGCSIPEFIDYIAAKFQPGMSWDNYGKWHLDHIRPLASFDLSDRSQFLIAAHFTNYQPLWAMENVSKGYKLAPSLQLVLARMPVMPRALARPV